MFAWPLNEQVPTTPWEFLGTGLPEGQEDQLWPLSTQTVALTTRPLTWSDVWPLTTQTITATTRTLTWGKQTEQGVYTADAYPSAIYPDPTVAPLYVARLVDTDHAQVVRFDNATDDRPVFSLGRITETLNEAAECTFTIPKTHPSTPSVVPLSTFIQIYRDGDLVFTGRIVGRSVRAGRGETEVTAKGRLWDLSVLVMGSANRRNLYRNGTFVDALDHWQVVGGITAQIGTAQWLRDNQSVRLSAGSADQNAYLRQSRTWRTEFPVGQLLTGVAWCWIDDGEWIGPAHEERGLMLIYRNEDGEAIATAFARIDSSTRREEWVRLSCDLVTPPFIDGRLDIHLYAVGGRVYWDDARVVMMEATTSGNYPVGNDQAETARRIIAEAQSDRGNPDLNLGTDTPATGRVEHYDWQHADHEWISDALRVLVDHPDGIDISIRSSPTTDTFVTHYPRRGTDRTLTLTLTPQTSAGGNLADWRYTEDGLGTWPDVIALGEAAGPGRSEGLFSDRTAVSGFVAQKVVRAPQGLPINELDDYAESIGETTKRIPVSFEVQVVGDDTHTIEVGDLVDVDVDDDAFTVTGTYRVITATWEPDGTRWLTLNWFPT